MQQSGGLLLPPVQTLVATIIFAIGKNANESPAGHVAQQQKGRRSAARKDGLLRAADGRPYMAYPAKQRGQSRIGKNIPLPGL